MASFSFATSWPAILAMPSVGSRMPQSIRMTVDLPDPFGPRNPKIDPCPTEKLTWSTAVNVPKRFVSPSHSIIKSGMTKIWNPGNQDKSKTEPPTLLDSWLPDSFYVWKNNIGGHPRAQFVVCVRQTNLYAIN